MITLTQCSGTLHRENPGKVTGIETNTSKGTSLESILNLFAVIAFCHSVLLYLGP